MADVDSTSVEALVDKIVNRRRGGFCYELNGAFAALLQALTCSLPTASGRVTLSGVRLIRTEHGTRSETRLESGAEVLAAYERYFGCRRIRQRAWPPSTTSYDLVAMAATPYDVRADVIRCGRYGSHSV